MKKKILFNSRFLKDRSLRIISDRFQAITEMYKSFYNFKWKQWYKDIKPLTEFWGYIEPSLDTSYKNKVIFSINDTVHHSKYIKPTDYINILRTTPDSDIPLLLADNFWSKEGRLIGARLNEATITDSEFKGVSLKPIPHRQDLVDRINSLEIRDNHICRCLDFYKKILINKITNIYQDKIYYSGTSILLILTIGKHTYHFSNTINREFGLMDCKIIYDTIN